MNWTLKNFPTKNDPRIYDVPQSQEFWKSDFEMELREKAIRLLQCRAGGRYTDFEAGMLYQICLVLGLEDSRPGKRGEQEAYWEGLILSCDTEAEAKQALEDLLQNKKVQTREDKRIAFHNSETPQRRTNKHEYHNISESVSS